MYAEFYTYIRLLFDSCSFLQHLTTRSAVTRKLINFRVIVLQAEFACQVWSPKYIYLIDKIVSAKIYLLENYMALLIFLI